MMHGIEDAELFASCMRGLFRWAAKAGIAKADPTTSVANQRL
jgi:hypothetical protein